MKGVVDGGRPPALRFIWGCGCVGGRRSLGAAPSHGWNVSDGKIPTQAGHVSKGSGVWWEGEATWPKFKILQNFRLELSDLLVLTVAYPGADPWIPT